MNNKSTISSRAKIAPSAEIASKSVLIEDNVIIGENVIIEEDVVINKGTVIKDGVIISSGTRIARYCNVGTGTFLDSDVRLFQRARVGNGVFIGKRTVISQDCIINVSTSPDVRVPAGAEIGNAKALTATPVVVPNNATFSNEDETLPVEARQTTENYVNGGSTVIGDVKVLSSGTLTATFYNLGGIMHAKTRSSPPVSFKGLSSRKDAQLYIAAKALYPEKFSFTRRLVNKLFL